MADKAAPDQAPPSYQDAARPPHLLYLEHANSNRLERISRLVEHRIEPFVLTQAQAGLSKSALIIVPSNVSSLQSKAKSGDFFDREAGAADAADEKILGFADDESVRLTRLEEEQDTLDFWAQPRVMAEMREGLLAKLGVLEPAAPASLPARPDDKAEKKRFWKRSAASSPWDSRGMSSIGAAAAAAKIAENGSGSADLSVTVNAEEVSLRIVSDMGLYEVQTGRALVVRIKMRV